MRDLYTLLRRLLILHEGERLKPYTDSVGKLTIGVGRNLTDRGISGDEAMLLLDNDVASVIAQVASGFQPWFDALDPVRQVAVLDLIFNLGWRKFLTFKATIAALARQDFEVAARHLESSLWYRQVKTRGPRIVAMVRTGALPPELRTP